jgi:hypothetical protein
LRFSAPKIRKESVKSNTTTETERSIGDISKINTVHLERPGLNLRDLLDCKANIDFAYQLFEEKHGFTAWSTYNSGKYRQFTESR